MMKMECFVKRLQNQVLAFKTVVQPLNWSRKMIKGDKHETTNLSFHCPSWKSCSWRSLIQPIPGESDSHIEFKCLVEYNGWFRRIIRVKDVKVISKTKEFKGKIDYSIPDPNKIEIQANGQFISPNDSSSFSNHEIISQPSQTNQAISVSEKGQANFATSSEASETQSVQFESNLKF